MKNERWLAISDYVGSYEVSDEGRVRNVKTGRILKNNDTGDGYYNLTLYNNGIRKVKLVHRLVGAAFLSNPLNLPCINHKDGDKINNVVGNIEWVTHSENSNHYFSSKNSRDNIACGLFLTVPADIKKKLMEKTKMLGVPMNKYLEQLVIDNIE